jgi:hypothetical protein
MRREAKSASGDPNPRDGALRVGPLCRENLRNPKGSQGGGDGAGSGLTYSARLVTAPDLPDQPHAKDVLRDLTGRERRHFGKGVVNQKLHLERPVSRDFTLSGCKAIFLHPIARFDLSFATKMAKTNFISAFPYLPQGVSGPCGRNFLADSAA